MRRFAKAGNRVIFVNSISMGLPGLSNKDLLPRIVRKLRSYARLARPTPEGVTVVSPAVIPFFGTRLARAANRKLLALQIGRLARRGGLTKPILWIAIPTAADMMQRSGRFTNAQLITPFSGFILDKIARRS